MAELRRTAAAVVLVLATVTLTASGVVAFSALSWSARVGPYLHRTAAAAAVLLVAGTVAWGVGRWRATLGAVLVAAGLVGATVAATIPLVTRSADWVARGGPSPNDAHAIAFLGTCGVAALAGRWLRSTQPDPRPLAVRPAQRGPAPIRERRGDPGVPR